MIRPMRRSSLFLMELIVSILIFSLCAGVCLSLFGSAQRMERESAALTRGAALAQSVAERFRGADGADALRTAVPFGEAGLGEWVAAFDADGRPADAPDAAYLAEIAFTAEGGLVTARVAVRDADGADIYALTCAKYAPGEVWA